MVEQKSFEDANTKTKEIVVKAFSKKTHGIMDQDETWYNLEHEPTEEDKKRITDLGKGDKIKLTINDEGKYTNFEITEKGTPSIMKFDDILAKAHTKFGDRLSIETMLHFTSTGTSVIADGYLASARVVIKGEDPGKDPKGKHPQIFTGWGDATKANTTGDDGQSSKVADALPRMAETRALGRALRFALGGTIVDIELPKNERPETSEDEDYQEGHPDY